MPWVRTGLATVIVAAALVSVGSVAAQDAAPTVPRLKYCLSPDTPVELSVGAAAASPVAATPVAGDPLPVASEIARSEIPVGTAADSDTVLELFALEVGYAACYNGGLFANAAALLTPDARVRFVEAADLAGFADLFANPKPLKGPQRIPSVLVHDEQLLPDGRAIAVVDWGNQSSLHVYVRDGDGWLLERQLTIVGE